MRSFLLFLGHFLNLSIRAAVLFAILITFSVYAMDVALSWDMIPRLALVVFGIMVSVLLSDLSGQFLRDLSKKNLPSLKQAIDSLLE